MRASQTPSNGSLARCCGKAPAKSTWTCGHRRLENSGTKGLSRCSIVVGRVGIITSLWRTGDDRTLPLLTLTKWTKSSSTRFGE